MVTKPAIVISLLLPVILGLLSRVDSMVNGHGYIIYASEWIGAFMLAAVGFVFAGMKAYNTLLRLDSMRDSLSVGYVWQAGLIDLALMFVLLLSIFVLQQTTGRVLLWVMFVPCLIYYGMGMLMSAYFVSNRRTQP